MSDKCGWCGLAAEHESQPCAIKDDSTHRIELHLSSRPLTKTNLAWIVRAIEEVQEAHPGKLLDVQLRHIGSMPKHEPFLTVEGGNGQWKCNGCGSWYAWASKDEDELEHCPKCCGTKIKCPVIGKSPIEQTLPLQEELNKAGMPLPSNLTVTGAEILRRNMEHFSPKNEASRLFIPTWLCTAHPPGSEVEVKKGEKCFCGRGEE